MASTDMSSTTDTTDAIGTKGKPVPAPVPATTPDTTEAGRVAARGWAPTPTGVSSTPDTLSSPVVDVYPPYKAPPAPQPGVTVDTTHTDSPTTDGTGGATFNPNLAMSSTPETGSIGAQPIGSTAIPVAPNTPTVVSGNHFITVSWSAVTDPATDAKVLGYVVECDTGGHAQAPRGANSVKFEQVAGGQPYRFRVRALNRNGDGPWSPFSSPSVSAMNYEAVPLGSLWPENKINPIYNQDGSIKKGSYGAPTAPGKPTVVAQGTSGTATVSWTASSPAPSGGYTVRASSGQSTHVASGVLTANVAGLTVSAVVTVTVQAIGALQSATSAASNNYTVV
ncbi:fibronectin type III domain-containing protein [Streptomyces sp. NPDC008079]|uniref:fibronectin type III domain-containing protein n=1 Tax=Streptomyces sp. NPDC008079 TaxID=3364806 RepID=UPI0036E8DAB8